MMRIGELMNPSSSFTFLPPNPNPNPNYFPHHPSITTPAGGITSPPDITTTLSTLKHLIHLSETTIQSISTLLRRSDPTSSSSSSSSSPLSTCPFNPNHRLPATALFRHYLQCPSSPATVDLAVLDNLHYPNSLQSTEVLLNRNKPFLQTLPDSDADLCFSLDEYHASLASNFFYRDCPGVVTFPDDQDNTATHMLTLPVVLSAECANFTGGMNVTDIRGLSDTKLLPSELWFVRNEIKSWNYYPTYYSSRVLRAILCSYLCRSCDLKDWLIVNSPRYGIVIDSPMRDHIHLLFSLCVKAITKEAVGSLSLLSRGEEHGCKDLKCPVLAQVLAWLAYQLSVLYGEANGRLFVIDMFKQSLLCASSSSLMFSDVQKDTKYPGVSVEDNKWEEPLNESSAKQEVTTWVIFVSQIAAAVAALQERAFLERKIKAMRHSRPLTNYQRVAEHGFESQKADEQRQKRSNYRPILEHDGFLWQRARNKENNGMKSREELLAEERDYKRRRTSYRGKKMKRSTTHVMRDIIEEYMEEIKLAGGIGCFVKGAEEAGMHASESFALPGISTDDEGRMSIPKSSEVHNEMWQGYNEQLNSENNVSSTRLNNETPERNVLQRQDSPSYKRHLEAYTGNKNMHDRGYRRNADDQRRDNFSYEKPIDRGQHADNKVHRKHLPLSLDGGRSRPHEKSHGTFRTHETGERKDSYLRNAYRKGRSDSAVHHEFEDRYDPSES